MPDQSLYNYYLQEVLGVSNFIAPESAAVEVLPTDYLYQNKTIVVTENPLTEKESLLLTNICCLLYTSPSPRDQRGSRMPSSA